MLAEDLDMADDAGQAPQQAVVMQVLVGTLADGSTVVREAAELALLRGAQRDAMVVLDCCITSLRTVKRRGGNHRANVLHVMAGTLSNMKISDFDNSLIERLASIALVELTNSKDLDSNWQRHASGLLVALCCQAPNMIMEEIFRQLTGNSVPVLSLVQCLAEFSSIDALQFVPHMKGVLSRVLPLLGGIKDVQKKTFADAFACWCEAMIIFLELRPSAPLLGPDMQALLHSAFDLFLGRWLLLRDQNVSLATVKALAQMYCLINTIQLKAALPKLLPAILAVYRKVSKEYFLVTHSFHMLLRVVLPSPMIEFQALVPILNVILPMASIYSNRTPSVDSATVLKNFHEVIRCFVIIGTSFPEDLFIYMTNKLGTKETIPRLGSFLILKHLLIRLSEVWSLKRSTLLDSLKISLQEQDFNLRKATSELIVTMASIGYLEQESAQPFLEFLIKQCAITDLEAEMFQTQLEALEQVMGVERSERFQNTFQLKMGVVSPAELRAVCDKSLLLLASTTPNMEVLLWPYLLRFLTSRVYTAAVATICKCISEILKRGLASGEQVHIDYRMHPDVPRPEDILARLIVLLRNPMARNQMASKILTVLFYVAPLFPTAIQLLWEDEIPKLKAYVSDSDDIKGDSWQQTTWEDMILHLLSESVDVIRSSDWTVSLANSLASQYDLYLGDHHHSALLHRCLGVVLEKIENRSFVREKIAIMYKRADIADATNRLGLAMGMGLVAASHLDTVLEKLKSVLDESKMTLSKYLTSFFDQHGKQDADNVFAALALMYGYAASYAPSTVIEARIDKLVGTNVLSRLLDVKSAAAKQAVINAINLLGQAVIKAAANGVPFPLKRRDQMLDYTMALMVAQGSGYFVGAPSILEVDSLHTQELAINACTTLVSVEPKLAAPARDRILQATLGFFTLPTEPAPIVNTVLENLTILLCVILRTSGEDGRSRADQLQHLLRSLDHYISSPVEYHRERAAMSVVAVLKEFRAFCTAGAQLLPSRDALKLGERVMIYLTRCADVSPVIRKTSAQILDLLFSISLMLPKAVGSVPVDNKQAVYGALSSLEELIAVSKWDSSAEMVGTLQQIVESVGMILSTEELVSALRCCNVAIGDKVPQCGDGATTATKQLIIKRGKHLPAAEIPRITESLFVAAAAIGEMSRQRKILETLCCLAQETEARVVMDEILAAVVKETQKKESVRHKGGWPIEETLLVFANDVDLALPFLDYLVSVLDQTPLFRDDEKNENVPFMHVPHSPNYLPVAAVRALATVFRVGGDPVRKALEQRYATVFVTLLLQMGSSHESNGSEIQASRDSIVTFQAFCKFVGDSETEKVAETSIDELVHVEHWIQAVGRLAYCVALTHPKEVVAICNLLWPALKRPYTLQRIAAAAALSEYVRTSKGADILLSQLVGVLSDCIGDESPAVRRLCVKGLVQVPKEEMHRFAPQILSVIVALVEDGVEEVANTAVQGLPLVLEAVSEETVAPVLLNLCVRLRSLQTRENVSLRAASFAALEKLSSFATVGPQLDAFLEQIHAILPRLILHINDEALIVRQACKMTFKKIAPLLGAEGMKQLTKAGVFESDYKLDYEGFVKDFTRLLVDHFHERIDTYLSSAIQAFDAPWPVIQANAILFIASMLSEIKDSSSSSSSSSSSVYSTQVISVLVRMVSSSECSLVRARAAAALGVLI